MTGATTKASPSLNDDSNPQQGTPASTTTTKRNVTVVAAATSTHALHLHNNNNSNNDGDDADVDVTVGTNRNTSTVLTTNTTHSKMTMTTTLEDATLNCCSPAGVSTGTATPSPPLSGHQLPPPPPPQQRPNPVHTAKQQQQPMKIPPTVKDIRKIFVGGLPSDGTYVVRLFCLFVCWSLVRVRVRRRGKNDHDFLY
jgi:hypothetical protein